MRGDGIYIGGACCATKHFADGGGLLGQLLGPGKQLGRCGYDRFFILDQLALLGGGLFVWCLVFRAQPADVALGLFRSALCVEGYEAG
jgi:hypothetical protein